MQKLWQKHQKFMKGNAGFSLVELIIVIAIMAALVAILAPQYIKYVSKSRDAALQASGEEVLAAAKAEYSLGNLTGVGTITVTKDGVAFGSGDGETLAYNDVSTTDAETTADFITLCNFQTGKSQSTGTYKITIGGTAAAPTFATSWTPGA